MDDLSRFCCHNSKCRNWGQRGLENLTVCGRFGKAPDIHDAMTYFSLYSYNFCWPVRTLRQQDMQGNWQSQTPAMVAGLMLKVDASISRRSEWLLFMCVHSCLFVVHVLSQN